MRLGPTPRIAIPALCCSVYACMQPRLEAELEKVQRPHMQVDAGAEDTRSTSRRRVSRGTPDVI